MFNLSKINSDHLGFGNLTILIKDGDSQNPWFFGRQVVEMLGYDLKTNSYAKYIDRFIPFKIDKKLIKINNLANNSTVELFADMQDFGRKGEIIISEAGLYRLIFNSKIDEAEKFQQWVFTDVLPSIRRTGGYNSAQSSIPTKTLESVFSQNTKQTLTETELAMIANNPCRNNKSPERLFISRIIRKLKCPPGMNKAHYMSSCWTTLYFNFQKATNFVFNSKYHKLTDIERNGKMNDLLAVLENMFPNEYLQYEFELELNRRYYAIQLELNDIKNKIDNQLLLTKKEETK